MKVGRGEPENTQEKAYRMSHPHVAFCSGLRTQSTKKVVSILKDIAVYLEPQTHEKNRPPYEKVMETIYVRETFKQSRAIASTSSSNRSTLAVDRAVRECLPVRGTRHRNRLLLWVEG